MMSEHFHSQSMSLCEAYTALLQRIKAVIRHECRREGHTMHKLTHRFVVRKDTNRAFLLGMCLIALIIITHIFEHNNDFLESLQLHNGGAGEPFSSNGTELVQQKTEEDIYDIILITGQSNMVGSARNEIENRYNHNQYSYSGALNIDEYASATGIESDILANNGETLNFVSVRQEKNTVYEYRYLTNSFREIDSTQKCSYGENLVYKDGELISFKDSDQSNISLASSSGTNMVPQFCQTYYALTGHKVIAVCAGKRGVPIQTFLPQDDNRNTRFECYVYEALRTKYNAATALAKKNKLHIGNKIYVIAQGESDIGIKTTKRAYERMFMTMHRRMKRELGIELGVIVETATTTGTGTMKMIAPVHQAQEELIRKNKDIILGSSYFYDRYVPAEEDYENCHTEVTLDINGTKLPYVEALRRSRFSNDPSYKAKEKKRNYIHFTSAALSHVGNEVATNIFNSMN